MNVKDAAIQVLRDAGEPLSAKEIAKRTMSLGLWQTTGKTPHATVAARLYSDIKTRGDKSPFVQAGPNAFALRSGNHLLPLSSRQAVKPQGRYSFTDAAERVLERFGEKKPMHYRQVTEHALKLDWIATEGKTPEATMYAQILSEIRRYQKRGDQPRFVQHGRGYVSLSKWMGKGLAFDIEQHNVRVRHALHKQLLAMDPTEFEELTARLLAEMGFDEIEVTQRTKDCGIDVRGTLVVGDVIRTRMAIQVKRWQVKSRIQTDTVQKVRGSLGTHEQGLIITTSDFTPRAREEAARPNAVPVGLMNGEQLVSLLATYGIGVTRQSHDIFTLGETSQ